MYMNLEYEKIVFYCCVLSRFFLFFSFLPLELLFCPSLKFYEMET